MKKIVLYKDLLDVNFNKTSVFLIIALGVFRGDLTIYTLVFIYARVSAVLCVDSVMEQLSKQKGKKIILLHTFFTKKDYFFNSAILSQIIQKF